MLIFMIPFFLSGILSITATAFVPIAAKSGFLYLLVARFLQGVAYSADFATIGVMTVRWAPLHQAGLFISVLTLFTPIATVVTNPLSGWLCTSSLGWRSSFYIHAIFGAVVFSFWLFLYRDDPQYHRSVSEAELSKIQRYKTKAHIERDSFVPYWEIMKNPVILVVWANAFTEMVSITLLLTYSPTFYKKILKYDVQTTGFLVAVAAGVHIPLKLPFGCISDQVKFLSEVTKMCICNTFAVGISGLLCASLALIPAENRDFTVVMFAIIYTAMGLNPGGFYKCANFVSRQYAHFVLAAIQFTKCIALFIAPLMVSICVKDEENHTQWGHAWILNGSLMMSANCLFYFFVTDEPAEFTKITRESRQQKKKSASLPIPMDQNLSGNGNAGISQNAVIK